MRIAVDMISFTVSAGLTAQPFNNVTDLALTIASVCYKLNYHKPLRWQDGVRSMKKATVFLAVLFMLVASLGGCTRDVEVERTRLPHIDKPAE